MSDALRKLVEGRPDPLLDMTPIGEQMRLEGTFGMKTRPRGENVKRYREFGQQVAASPLAVRAPRRAAPGILQTGDIRSQHETGESKGYLDPEYRARTEAAMGFDDHPVYGYLDAEPDRTMSTEHYGELKFTMKDAVKDRTTILNGDSLTNVDHVGHVPRPVPVRHVQKGVRLPKESDAWEGGDQYDAKIHGYVEAQIHARPEDPVQPSRWTSIPFSTPHSRVPLSDVHSLDIDHNRLGSRRSGPDPDLVNLGAQFQERGVSTWHTYRENDYQPPLPFGHSKLMDEHGFEEHHLGALGGGSTYVRYPSSGSRGPENFRSRNRMKHQSQL